MKLTNVKMVLGYIALLAIIIATICGAVSSMGESLPVGFLDGNVIVTDWYDYYGDQIMIARLADDYQPTPLEIATVLQKALQWVELSDYHRFAIYFIKETEKYGDLITFTFSGTSEEISLFLAEECADCAGGLALLEQHFIWVDATPYWEIRGEFIPQVFWDGGGVILNSLDIGRHRAAVAYVDYEYEITTLDLLLSLKGLLAWNEPDVREGFYFHVTTEYPGYGTIVGYTITTSRNHIEGFAAAEIPKTEEDRATMLYRHFPDGLNADAYYYYMGAAPQWRGDDDVYFYTAISSMLLDHPWQDELYQEWEDATEEAEP